MPALHLLASRFPVGLSVLIGIILGSLQTLSPAQAQQEVPALAGHVVDRTGTLDTSQLQQLENKLNAFEHSAGAQIVLLLVPSTQPEDVFSYANRVANSWKIGRKDIGDGVLLVVAKDDHKVRIEVAKSLEGAIPDLAARMIIEQSIAPHFKQGDFAVGLDLAVDQISARITGEALLVPTHVPGNSPFGLRWNDLLVFAFFAVPVIASGARRALGFRAGSVVAGGLIGAVVWFFTANFLITALAALAGLLFTLISAVARGTVGAGWGMGHGGGWGGGGFRPGGGGGFSSGGGGDFGGGGASGDW
jgi:uncharacterized protein